MPGEHAILSPSSAERWSTCLGSVGLIADLGPSDTETAYAREGTYAHEMGYMKARLEFKQITQTEYGQWYADWVGRIESDPFFVSFPVDLDEMEQHTDAYVVFIVERAAVHPNTVAMFEQRVNTGVPQCWGTADVVLVSPVHVEIIDLKYGMGVFVSVIKNPQLRLYGVGALEDIADLLGDVYDVTCTVFQPRMGNVASEVLTAVELRAWRDDLIPLATWALEGSDVFAPSEDTCRYCPVSGRCAAQMKDIFTTDFADDPRLLTPQDQSELLGRVSQVRDWLNAFEEKALATAYSEQIPIPGYKVVMSGGKRGWSDGPTAVEVLTSVYDIPLDEVAKVPTGPPPVRGIGEVTKVLKKRGLVFEDLLEQYVTKGSGKPSLVPEGDPRPAIDPNSEAQKAFAPEEETA